MYKRSDLVEAAVVDDVMKDGQTLMGHVNFLRGFKMSPMVIYFERTTLVDGFIKFFLNLISNLGEAQIPKIYQDRPEVVMKVGGFTAQGLLDMVNNWKVLKAPQEEVAKGSTWAWTMSNASQLIIEGETRGERGDPGNRKSKNVEYILCRSKIQRSPRKLRANGTEVDG